MEKLEGKRVYLRAIEIGDAEKLWQNTQDRSIRYMTGTKANFTLEQVIKHIENIKTDNSRYDFAICLKETDELIGECGVLDIDEENQSAGFRITMMGMSHTGKGYGTEAIQIILRFVFNSLRLNRLQLEVYSHNKQGIRAYEKSGFVYEGCLREALFYQGEFSDEQIMGILKSDYEKLSFFD